jgi:serine/threonine protein kinase
MESTKQNEIDLGDFIVHNIKIGKGSFSTIYMGKDKLNNNTVAIKKLDVDNVYKLKKNIKREIELHKKIKHRNIINLYDVIYDTNLHYVYLVLEYCKSGDFSKFQNKRPIKEIFIQKYINDLANGLKYLNDLNIIHRDLKPQNLLMSDCGDLKIGDFGFAKEFEEMDDLKNTYCGSPLYMAPEILHYRKYNSKSDLWSVGIIIYEMITGKPPYHVKNFYQLMKLIEKDEIILPQHYKNTISNNLHDLLSKLLIKDPINRIDWCDFFKNKWLTDKILENENKLLSISMNDSLPNIQKMQCNMTIPNNKFISTELDTQKQSYNSKSFTTNLQSGLSIIDKHFNNDLDFNILFSESIESGDSFYSMKSSFDETDAIKPPSTNEPPISKSNELKNEIQTAINTADNSRSFPLTKPIAINTQSKSSYKSYKSYITKTSLELEKEYDVVNEKDLSNPLSFNMELNINKNAHPSNQTQINEDFANHNQNLNISSKNKKFKKILHTSITILRESYDYLSSHNKSI